MIICKNRFRKSTKHIQMTASGHKVKQVSKVKILRYMMQSNLHHDKHIAQITSNINNRLHNIKKLAMHTTIKSRLILTKAIVIGKLNYCLPLLCNATKKQLAKLNTLITKSCRVIMGSPCLKWTSSRLLNKCKLKTIWHMITIWVVRRKINKQTDRPVQMILTLLSKGRFRDQAYFSLCIHCLFGIYGLKLHTVASAWTAALEEWKLEFSS